MCPDQRRDNRHDKQFTVMQQTTVRNAQQRNSNGFWSNTSLCSAAARLAPKTAPGGFSLPLALFILVVLGLLATVLYRTIAIGNLSVAQEAISARAFLAADSGAQAGMMRLFPIDGSPALCSASVSQTLTGAGFNNCSVELNCTSQTVDGDAHYYLTSTAICTAGTLRASRIVEVAAHNLVN